MQVDTDEFMIILWLIIFGLLMFGWVISLLWPKNSAVFERLPDLDSTWDL